MVAPRSPWDASSTLRRRRLHEPRLDPELAHPQPLVGLERDLGPGQQREALAGRVLEQVRGSSSSSAGS